MKKKSDKRRLFEVVGALDKTFKLKLHENRQPLNEKDWHYTINITQPWEAYEEQEDVAAFRVSILDILRKASEEIDTKFGEDVSYELETSVIDEFEMGEDVEDMDYALSQLFDWADENDIWVERMDTNTPAPAQPQQQQQPSLWDDVDGSPQWKGISMNEEPGQAVSYNTIFEELSEVLGGEQILKVMEILKKHNLVQGDLEKDVQWMFNFDGGGWNTVLAKTREEAVQKVKQQYGMGIGTQKSMPNYNSIRPSSKDDYEANMGNFN